MNTMNDPHRIKSIELDLSIWNKPKILLLDENERPIGEFFPKRGKEYKMFSKINKAWQDAIKDK